MKRYAELLREMIINGVDASDRLHPLRGMKIVVDAGNGAGGFYARDVLEPLGAEIYGVFGRILDLAVRAARAERERENRQKQKKYTKSGKVPEASSPPATGQS